MRNAITNSFFLLIIYSILNISYGLEFIVIEVMVVISLLLNDILA